MATDVQSSGNKLSSLWPVLGTFHAIFLYWYTPFSGSLTDEEIAHFISVIDCHPELRKPTP